ncbi:hypothetical protein EOA25_04665 [Mesorhizobium sp. M2A.F.Ca.ET.040.01.1.1]|nr:hypothetical protein EOA25_04665 [Mesorhizobium sp. M2A.F.Ca.ET.040.01.1.1]
MDDQSQNEAARSAIEDRTDAFIRSLAEYANGAGLGVGITVLSHGMLVSGITMSNVDFFKQAKDKWSEATPLNGASEVAEDAKKLLLGHADNMMQLMRDFNAKGRDQDPPDFDLPVYLHLQDARIMAPGQPSIKVDYWRCRIDQISGFTLGQITD